MTMRASHVFTSSAKLQPKTLCQPPTHSKLGIRGRMSEAVMNISLVIMCGTGLTRLMKLPGAHHQRLLGSAKSYRVYLELSCLCF
jgi:hypothetical protein